MLGSFWQQVGNSLASGYQTEWPHGLERYIESKYSPLSKSGASPGLHNFDVEAKLRIEWLWYWRLKVLANMSPAIKVVCIEDLGRTGATDALAIAGGSWLHIYIEAAQMVLAKNK